MDLWIIYVLFGLVSVILLFITFVIINILKLVKSMNRTVIETAKQVIIIDRNTYPRQNKKSL